MRRVPSWFKGQAGLCITDLWDVLLQDAATLPTVMATVDAAFGQAADVRPGDRVLVHAATGGVGLAAVQMLQVITVSLAPVS